MGTWKHAGRPLQPNEVLVKEHSIKWTPDLPTMVKMLDSVSLEGWDYVNSWAAEPGGSYVLLKRVTVKNEREVKQAYDHDGTPMAKEYEGARVQRGGNKSVRDHYSEDRFPRLYDVQGGG